MSYFMIYVTSIRAVPHIDRKIVWLTYNFVLHFYSLTPHGKEMKGSKSNNQENGHVLN